jgi:hypothetical protein
MVFLKADEEKKLRNFLCFFIIALPLSHRVSPNESSILGITFFEMRII